MREVWINNGAKDCRGEALWEERDGLRVFSCSACSLHWYQVLEK